ncbi:FecCD family ABC transporter permease [Microbacterium sp. GXF7504]
MTALLLSVVLLLVAVWLGFTVGARPIPVGTVWEALVHPDAAGNDAVVVLDQRLPRTVIGILAGASLAVAGTLMQGLTRNPLADPGLFGINAGASVAVLTAITVFGITRASGFVWFAFLGAAVSATIVALVGARGPDGGNPAKLALTGAAVTAGLTAVTTLILVTSVRAFDVFRYWQVGGLTARGLDTVALVLLPIVVGLVLALACARGLDLLALGDRTASALGHHVGRTRALGIVATVLLSGAATAIAGPIVFIGLAVPHLVRGVLGGTHRDLMLVAAPLGAALLVLADVVGRVIALPGEVQAGLVVAFLGAPMLIAIVLRRKQVAL